MIDPRQAIIGKRLEGVGRILAFASGKGGVGKSACSAVAAILLSRAGFRTGLLDLDFQGASSHIFLGAHLALPEETHGIKPLLVASGIRFMSFAAFTGEKAVPLRGVDVTNAFLELLAITIWGNLDFLVIDMPPGIGDEVLDLIRLVGTSEYIVICRASKVSAIVVERLLALFRETKAAVAGVVENMAVDGSSDAVRAMTGRMGVPLLGTIPFYRELEGLIGHPEELASSSFAADLAGSLRAFGISVR